MGALRCASQRFHVIFDETVWTPSSEQIMGLRRSGAGVVGGCWAPEGDQAFIPCGEGVPTPKVDRKDLAKCTLNFIVKRCDDNCFTFDCCQLPRKGPSTSAKDRQLSSSHHVPSYMSFSFGAKDCGLIPESALKSFNAFPAMQICAVSGFRFFSPPAPGLRLFCRPWVHLSYMRIERTCWCLIGASLYKSRLVKKLVYVCETD